MTGRLQVVASGDYRHTRGRADFRELGFDAFDGGPFDLRIAPSASQADAVAPEDLREADALVLLGQRLEAASLARAERLAIVARAGAGIDKIDVGALTRRGVLLFNVPDALTRATASGALTLMLAAGRQLVAMDRLTREGRWDDRQFHRGRDVYGKTLGVIGPGRIGAELIRIAAPFGMEALAYSPRLTPDRAAKIGARAVPLEELLARGHFVAICAPLTDETRGMIGAREIGRMRRDAVLVNVGRGPIVDQAALVAALRERRIAGAGLDVFETQPVSAGDPLAALDNVVLSPHAICDTYELRRDVLAEIARQLAAFLAGARPASIVEPSVWDDPEFRRKRARLLDAAGSAPS